MVAAVAGPHSPLMRPVVHDGLQFRSASQFVHGRRCVIGTAAAVHAQRNRTLTKFHVKSILPVANVPRERPFTNFAAVESPFLTRNKLKRY